MISLFGFCTLGVLVAQAVTRNTHQLPVLDCEFPVTLGHSKPAEQDSGNLICANPPDASHAGDPSPSIPLTESSERNSGEEGIYPEHQSRPVVGSRADVNETLDDRSSLTQIPDELSLTSDGRVTISIGKREIQNLEPVNREKPRTNATNLGEISKFSDNPLKDAFSVLPTAWIEGLLASSTDIITNIFPSEKQHGFVTGLEGKLKLPKDIIIGDPHEERQKFFKNDELNWAVRWDYDLPDPGKVDCKYVHVNSEWATGKGALRKRVSFAYRLDENGCQWFKRGDTYEIKSFRTINTIWLDMNRMIGYAFHTNVGKRDRDWQSGLGPAMNTLKDYFRRVATGETIPRNSFPD